jgi:tetratricopeptide (TPR) repeat protein
MPDSASKELVLVKNLINEGRTEDALQQITDIEKMENLTPEDTLRTLYYKGRIYFHLGQSDASLKIAEELDQRSHEMKMPLFSLDAFALRGSILYKGGLPDKQFYTNLKQYENLFKSIPREDSLEFQEREVFLLYWKGAREFNIGKLDLALEYFGKSLTLIRRADPRSFLVFYNLMGLAFVYQVKGESNIALEHAIKALSLNPDNENLTIIYRKAPIYRIMGSIYFSKGELNLALEYHSRDLEIQKKVDRSGGWMPYSSIIEVLLAQKEITQAQNYLQEFKEYNDNHGSKNSKIWYQYAHALILKSSSRMRDHTEAESIFKKIVEDDSIILTIYALKNLCELYFEEFQFSKQMEILDDIQQLIKHLQRFARRMKSYFLIANVKLLQAKFALLQVSMVEARKLLTEAQKIADEHDLQLLAGEISREHDRLLEELKLWDSFKKEQASVTDRLKLASIDGVMERLQGRRAIEVPEVSVEEPILLLIMDKSGVSYFNHSFIGDWDFDDLFSSFMSAFNTFSSEIFSNSIDRVKIADNTILINPIEPFLACYVIKGQSYPAQQKLTRFSDAIKASPEIWDALNKAVKTSEMLELDNPPSLGSVVKEIFV